MQAIMNSLTWLVTEYKRVFLFITMVFALSPISLIVVFVAMMVGQVNSPMYEKLNLIEQQHIQQIQADIIQSRGIIDNHKSLSHNKDYIKNNTQELQKIHHAQVATCLATVGTSTNSIAWQRCTDLLK